MSLDIRSRCPRSPSCRCQVIWLLSHEIINPLQCCAFMFFSARYDILVHLGLWAPVLLQSGCGKPQE